MDAKIAFLNLALNKLIAFQRAFQAMEQRFVNFSNPFSNHWWKRENQVKSGNVLLTLLWSDALFSGTSRRVATSVTSATYSHIDAATLRAAIDELPDLTVEES